MIELSEREIRLRLLESLIPAASKVSLEKISVLELAEKMYEFVIKGKR
jgi:hypothetical protein